MSDPSGYDLKRGRKVVHEGTTNDPERLAEPHRDEGKRFERLVLTSCRMTEDGARNNAKAQPKQFRRTHCGRNPQYNEDSDG